MSETLSIIENFFGKEHVIEEWNVGKNSEDSLQKGLQYCPRIDFAIKPLNTDRNFCKNQILINETYTRNYGFFEELKKIGIFNREWETNNNPRCFLAIEYENKTTTKHRVGSLINACALGKVGIVVAESEKTFRSYQRIIKYLKFLQIHDKLPICPSNYIILKQNSFEKYLKSAEFLSINIPTKKVRKIRKYRTMKEIINGVTKE